MFWERYTFLCEQICKSPNAFAKEIGAKTSACTYWKNGTIPNGETLLKIASNFGCSIDYLLGRTDNPYSHKERLSGIINQSNVNSDNSSVTIKSSISENDNLLQDFINAFNVLPFVKKVKAMDFVNQLNKKI